MHNRRTVLVGGIFLLVGVVSPVIAQSERQPEAGKHYTIYLMAGQSNMDGRGRAKDLEDDLARFAQPNERVLVRFSSGGYKRHRRASRGFVDLQPGINEKAGQFGPEIGFGHAMATACPDQNILVIKVSEGGTSLRQDWNPDDPKSLYHRLTAVTKETCDLLTRAGATYAFGGMVWHQGESDSNRPDEYPALLTAFIDRVRTDLNAPGMPLVAGGLCADNPKYEGLNAALQKLAETTKDVGFASSKGLTTFDKNVHFDARSQLELGRRMAEAMLALTKAD